MSAGKGLFDAALAAEGVTGQLADVARSIYMQESGGGRNTKTSNAGAVGGMQIIPPTFKSVADKDWSIDDPMHNARAGIRYLKQLHKQAAGDPALTAAGYYGGPGGLEKARKGIAVSDPRNPNAPNTRQYGQQVVARLGKGEPASKPAATPAQLPEGATSQGVAVTASPYVPIPLDAVASMPTETPASVGVGSAGPDPWQEFLSSMARSQGQQRQAQGIEPADLNYGFAPRAPMANRPVGRRNLAPNFSAFSGWKGLA